MVAHPRPGVATRLNGGQISHPIRSLLDTGSSAVTVTTGQAGQAGQAGQVGGGLHSSRPESAGSSASVVSGPAGGVPPRSGPESSPLQQTNTDETTSQLTAGTQPDPTGQDISGQTTGGRPDRPQSNEVNELPLSERLRAPTGQHHRPGAAPNRLRSPSGLSQQANTITKVTRPHQTSRPTGGTRPNTHPRPIVFVDFADRFAGPPRPAARPGGSLESSRPPQRKRPASLPPPRTTTSPFSLKNQSSSSIPQSTQTLSPPPLRKGLASPVPPKILLSSSLPPKNKQSSPPSQTTHPSSPLPLKVGQASSLPQKAQSFSAFPLSNKLSPPFPLRTRPSSALPQGIKSSLLPPPKVKKSSPFPTRARPSSPKRRRRPTGAAGDKKRVQGYDSTPAPLFIPAAAVKTKASSTCRRIKECRAEDRSGSRPHRCRFARDCAGTEQCCFNRCLGIPVCQK